MSAFRECLCLCAASLCLALAGAALAAGEPDRLPPEDAQGHPPPPEAVAACSGQPEGTRVRFTGRRGEPVAGVCVRMGSLLAARPERPPGPPPDARHAPPR